MYTKHIPKHQSEAAIPEVLRSESGHDAQSLVRAPPVPPQSSAIYGAEAMSATLVESLDLGLLDLVKTSSTRGEVVEAVAVWNRIHARATPPLHLSS